MPSHCSEAAGDRALIEAVTREMASGMLCLLFYGPQYRFWEMGSMFVKRIQYRYWKIWICVPRNWTYLFAPSQKPGPTIDSRVEAVLLRAIPFIHGLGLIKIVCLNPACTPKFGWSEPNLGGGLATPPSVCSRRQKSDLEYQDVRNIIVALWVFFVVSISAVAMDEERNSSCWDSVSPLQDI